ncbi:MAG: GHKL domain-containing protein [Clostridiales bacterium]|nr:GHKL domain-containing protein [Clostridiales bacterium]
MSAGFFLRNSVGFFIQIFTCTLLCFLPFPKEAFRYRRRWILIGYGILSILLSVLFPLGQYLPSIAKLPDKSLFANLYMLGAVVIFTVFYIFLIRDLAIKKLLVVNLAVFYAATQYMLVNLITPLFPDGDVPGVYRPQGFWAYVITSAILFPLASWAFYRTVRSYLEEIDPQNIRRELSVIVCVSVIYVVLVVFITSFFEVRTYDYWGVAAPLFLFSMLVLLTVYWLLLKESVRRKRDAEYRRMTEVQRIQYQKITREIDNTRRMRHDLRYYLLGLYDLAEQDKTEEMKSYLKELLAQTEKRETECFCQNQTINALLQYYIGWAKESGISCEVLAECGEIGVSPADLTVVLGNTLENAIHACQEASRKPKIRIDVGIIGGSLAIQVENTCDAVHPSGKYPMNDGFLPSESFASARPDGGQGLKSISAVARKYGGTARFRYLENSKTFTTQIRLNILPEGERGAGPKN